MLKFFAWMFVNTYIFIHFLLVYCFVACGLGFYRWCYVPGYLNLRWFTSCYQCIYHLGGGYMDAWMNFSVLQLVSWGLWCVISLYHICPSKVRAYNSKGELKILLFLYVCSLTCRHIFGRWGASIRGWGVGIRGIRGGRAGIRGICG